MRFTQTSSNLCYLCEKVLTYSKDPIPMGCGCASASDKTKLGFARVKHPSLLRQAANCNEKKFNDLIPRTQRYK